MQNICLKFCKSHLTKNLIFQHNFLLYVRLFVEVHYSSVGMLFFCFLQSFLTIPSEGNAKNRQIFASYTEAATAALL